MTLGGLLGGLAGGAVVSITVKAIDQASPVFRQVGSNSQAMSSQMKAQAGAMIAASVAITAALVSCSKAAMANEASVSKLRQSMNNVGLSYDANRQQLEKWLDTNMRVTAFADEDQREALSQLVIVTKNLTSAQGALSIAMDVARWKSIDLSTAAGIIGKVLNGNVSILTRYGIAIDKDATATQALAAIQRMAAGQAQAFGQTSAGQWAILTESINELKEALGEALLPVIQTVTQALTSLVNFFRSLPSSVRTAITVIAALTAAFLGVRGVVILIGPLLTGLVAGLRGATTAMAGLGSASVGTGGMMGGLVGKISGLIAGISMIITGVAAIKDIEKARTSAIDIGATASGSYKSFTQSPNADSLRAMVGNYQNQIAALEELRGKTNWPQGEAEIKKLRDWLAPYEAQLAGVDSAAAGATGSMEDVDEAAKVAAQSLETVSGGCRDAGESLGSMRKGILALYGTIGDFRASIGGAEQDRLLGGPEAKAAWMKAGAPSAAIAHGMALEGTLGTEEQLRAYAHQVIKDYGVGTAVLQAWQMFAPGIQPFSWTKKLGGEGDSAFYAAQWAGRNTATGETGIPSEAVYALQNANPPLAALGTTAITTATATELLRGKVADLETQFSALGANASQVAGELVNARAALSMSESGGVSWSTLHPEYTGDTTNANAIRAFYAANPQYVPSEVNPNNPMVGPTGVDPINYGVRGYANEGIAWHPQIARVGEREPEAIIKLSRLIDGGDRQPINLFMDGDVLYRVVSDRMSRDIKLKGG